MTRAGRDSTDVAIERWADAEFLPWRSGAAAAVADAVDAIVHEDDSVFRFRIADGRVTVVAKNEEWSEMGHPLFARWHALTLRADLYRQHFQDAVDVFALRGTADMAVDLDDLASHPSFAPVICFQKTRGSFRILVPDLDFLDSAYYLSDVYVDSLNLADKNDRAIFVGSTTGMLNISRAIIDNDGHQRIRSARFFKDHADILFELPGIVQCDGPDTEEYIRSLAIGSTFQAWQEQFRNRYILSLDGNGATCSRVAVGLASNSVLIRYQSPNELYYFRGLLEWKHYVPVRDDQGVVAALTFLRSHAGLSAKIVEDASAFYDRHLSRAGILAYTAAIIRRYIATFGESGTSETGGDAALLVDSAGRFAKGDVLWSAPGGWLRHPSGAPLEELLLVPGPALAPAHLVGEARRPDGRAGPLPAFSDRARRGDQDGIREVRIDLTGAAADTFRLCYEAEFLDGTTVGPVPQGSWCGAASGAPMTGIRMRSTLRDTADGR